MKNYLEIIERYKDDNLKELFLSKEQLDSCNIYDIMGNQIFNKYDNREGILLFIDDCVIANWSHACTYIFISEEGNLIEKGYWPPSENIEVDKIL